jgi:APA family basic amino acid/polyamine antiporter
MPELGKQLKPRQFFSLAFGTIVGVGWILVLGQWLELAGPAGTLLAFAAGALLMMTIGVCYAELAALLPVSGGEVAYTYEIFGLKTSFAAGWALSLAYVAVTTFEAVSVGWIATTIFPALQGAMFYMTRGEPVHTGSLTLGLGGMALLTYLNYRGIKSAAIFQEIFTYALVILSLAFILAGIIWGNVSNLEPLFSKAGTGPALMGILGVFVMTPFFLSGFNVIPQTMEEKAEGASTRIVVGMILLSIGLAATYYILVILSSSMAAPWKKLVDLELPAAGAFEMAFDSPLMAKVVLFAGLCGLVTTWNTVFISSSRIIFALGRARIIPAAFGRVHPAHRSPYVAVVFAGVVATMGVFWGRSTILPIVNVAASCFALAFLTSCLGLIKLRGKINAVPLIGALSSVFMLFLSLHQQYANAKGAFPIEWMFILLWAGLGILFWLLARRIRSEVSEPERRKLILGAIASSDQFHDG